MSEPRVAVVIPIFKQPALAVEAFESALRQQTTFDYRVVAVNDGCPFAETDRVCRAYARAYPERFRYVHRKNAGLSAARNTGVAIALHAWPTVEAVQMLDSDDRLGPLALETAYQTLREHPEAGWVFPSATRFGFDRAHYDTSGPWSTLELLTINYLSCASMVRRAVFEHGLRYDEQMKLGYEDWDLWIEITKAGMPGRHAPEMAFHYRKRGDSMLSGSVSNHEVIMGYMRRKHRALYAPAHALTLEHQEFPRYAIWLSDTRRLLLTSDPCQDGEVLAPEELAPRLARAAALPGYARFPLRFVVTSEAFLRLARQGRFAAGLFWALQHRLDDGKRSCVTLSFEAALQTDACLQVLPSPPAPGPARAAAALVMLPSERLHECLQTHADDWLGSLFADAELPDVETVRLRYARRQGDLAFPADALQQFVALVREQRPAYPSQPRLDLMAGKEHWRLPNDPCDMTWQLYEAGPLYPLRLDPERLHIAFVLPICDFGGAERVSLNLAREAKRRGWAPHLFVIGSASARLLSEFQDVFESVAVLHRYEQWRPEFLRGFLGTMDVVVNNNCWHLNEVMAPLQRMGVKTYTHLHSITLGPHGVPLGQGFEALRYEHSLDGVIVISRKLARWCRSLGVPEAKIVHAPNAASFEVSDALLDTTLIERAGRDAAGPLRVLFIGRFDAEKGLDRLAALVSASQARGLPLEWRVVGRAVIGHGPPERDMAPIRPFVHPPALSAAALSRVYRWADVVLMLSRYEGVPLAILEGQRFGCVPVSTAVGAIDELIEDGRTGLLVSNELDTATLTEKILATLVDLHHDRGRLLAMARAVAALRRQVTWSDSFDALARHVRSILPDKGATAA